MISVNKCKNFLREIFINSRNKKRLHTQYVSVISSNCNGACILHDLGMKFQSPFVNLWLKPDDYLKLCYNLHEYMDEELIFISEPNVNYPVGMLRDIKIYFQHYSTEEEAKSKWNERKNRIDYNNLYFLFTDRDGCSDLNKKRFQELPYKNKVLFTHIHDMKYPCSVYIPGFEQEGMIGEPMHYKSRLSLKKYYDAFDYVEWINSGKVRPR